MERDSPRMFRVRVPSDAHRFGVVAVSLDQLLTEAARKLGLAEKKDRPLRVCLEDGTAVDEDYFSVLDKNTCLVILKRNERWTEGVENRFKHKREEMRYRCKTRMRGYLSDVRLCCTHIS
ncbi:unnamed protein product [Lampetra planeri]